MHNRTQLKYLACAVNVIPKDGEKDIHGDVGEDGYKGYRHSLCHGWSSGAVPFLLHDVLGIQIMEPGFKKVRVTPYLGKSDRMKGSIPTPYGNIKVAVSKCDGKEKVKISAPLRSEVLIDESICFKTDIERF